jgi:PIN domain nuclease of toxin-antitoxin system
LTGAVLDASALLVVLFEERGAEIVREVLIGSLVSAVNYSEVISKALDRERSLDATLTALAQMPFVVAPHDFPLALRAGELRPLTKHLGLSVGDRACLALAERERCSAYTTDRDWANLKLGIDIQLIR